MIEKESFSKYIMQMSNFKFTEENKNDEEGFVRSGYFMSGKVLPDCCAACHFCRRYRNGDPAYGSPFGPYLVQELHLPRSDG
jgi:hypothetical protein